MALPILASLSGIGLLLLGPLLTSNVIDNALSPRSSTVVPSGILLVALAGAIGALAALLARRVSISAGQAIGATLARDLHRRLFALPLTFFARQASAALAHRVQSVDNLRGIVLDSGVQAVSQCLIAATALVVLVSLSPIMAAVAVAAFCATVLLESLLRRSHRERTAVYIAASQAYSVGAIDIIHCMQPIKLSGVHDSARSHLSTQHAHMLKAELELERLKANHSLVRGIVAVMFSTLMLIAGSRLLQVGALSVGDYVATIAYAGMVAAGLGAISILGEMSSELFNADGRIGSLLRRQEDWTEDRLDEKGSLGEAVGAIACEQLHFAYSKFDAPVLRGVTFHANPREIVAIVAPSGTGKSTLARILVGAVRPTSGRVYVNGKSAIGGSGTAIATVMQDDRLITGSVFENINLFRGRSQAEVERAARLACIHDTINTMPMRYETLISDSFSGLSGGQRQRILLARALLAKPDILLLDEATNALDATTELAILDSIRALSMTTLLFTHRLESIEAAHRVYQLVDGRAELLRDVAIAKVDKLVPARPTA